MAEIKPGITGAHGAEYNPKAPGAQLDALFDTTADYLSCMYHRRRDAGMLAKAAKVQEIQNSFGSLVPADGGFLIPERMRADLLRVALETAIVRPRARVIPMDSLRVPFPTIDDTSHASNVYGGLTAYWTEEAAALTESQARFGRITLEAKKLTAYGEIPNELLSDSIISLAALINEIYPEALAWFEDIAFIRGTGAGEPFGFFNAPAVVSVAAEAGQATNTIVWENIVTMYSRMLPSSLNRAVWVAHINTFRELATMALSVGTGGAPIWLNNGTEGPPMAILGRPVIFTEKAATLGTIGDISFVDFGYYLIGDRQTMTSLMSEHFRFSTDKVAMRFIERLDGRAWLQSAITPNQGSTTLSPFVQLATRP